MEMKYEMRNTKYENGFTLVELIVALMITAIISTAVASLAYALSSANDATGDTSEKQAQIRYATFRISELVKHCKLICATRGQDIAVWRADDNADDKININELVYIETGDNRNFLSLCEFTSSTNPAIELSDIDALASEWWLGFGADEQYTPLIPSCGNVRFTLSMDPPSTTFVSISFDLTENGATRQYQIAAALRGRAGNLLDESGNIVAGDDD